MGDWSPTVWEGTITNCLASGEYDQGDRCLVGYDDLFDAIETGRQWETIARIYRQGANHKPECICIACEAFRDVAARTPIPTDGA